MNEAGKAFPGQSLGNGLFVVPTGENNANVFVDPSDFAKCFLAVQARHGQIQQHTKNFILVLPHLIDSIYAINGFNDVKSQSPQHVDRHTTHLRFIIDNVLLADRAETGV